ncbi:MAG: hypothetical protein AAGH46_02520 [Bacteroidota bacterium]
MKPILFYISIFVLPIAIQAQATGQLSTYGGSTGDGGVSDALYQYALGSISGRDSKTPYANNNIQGSPYLSNSFDKALMYYGDEFVGDIYFRYNGYNEEIEIKQTNIEGEPIKGLGKDKKIKLVYNGNSLSFKTFIDKNGGTKNGYLTLIKDGHFKLYRHLKIVFKEAKKAENSLVKGTPAKFLQSDEFYLEQPSEKSIRQIELNNRKIIQLFNDDTSSDLKEFLKNNKIKVNDENDLHQVINFLNEKYPSGP